MSKLKEAAPEITRVAVIYNALNPVHEPAVVAIETAAKQLKVQTERLPVRASADFDSVFPVMTRRRMDAVTVLEDPMINSQSLRVVVHRDLQRHQPRIGRAAESMAVESPVTCFSSIMENTLALDTDGGRAYNPPIAVRFAGMVVPIPR